MSEGDIIWCEQVVKCFKGLLEHLQLTENDWRGEMSPFQTAAMIYKSPCIDCVAACTGYSFSANCLLSPFTRLLSSVCLLSAAQEILELQRISSG